MTQNNYVYNLDQINSYGVENITKIIKQETNRTQNIANILKQGIIFIVFSAFNCFFPLFLCLIGSLVNNSGAQVVMGIGYAATFQLSFAQLGITFSISLFFLFNLKRKNFSNDNDNFIRCLFFTIFIGCISLFIYVLSSYLYLQYSNNRPNTLETINYGLDFVYSSVGFILFSSLEAYLFLLVYRFHRWSVVLLYVARSCLMILLAYLLCCVANLKALGIGLSLTIGIMTSTIPCLIYVIRKNRFFIFKKIRIFPKHEHLLKQIAQESVSGISLSLAKGLAILCLNLLMTAKLSEYIPLSYQMSRVIWFNVMYAVPWFAYGLSDAIKYNDLYEVEKKSTLSKYKQIRTYWILFLLSMIIGTLFCIGGYFVVKPLALIYIKNSHFNGIVPPIQGLSEELEKIFTSNLPPTNFPDIAQNDTFDTYIKKLLSDRQWQEWIYHLNVAMGKGQQWFENWLSLARNFDAFKQWFISYLSSTSYNADVIKALLLYQTPEQINHVTTPLLFAFKNSGFNAKAYLYICIYGILCCGWSVLLPANTVVEQKQFPPILLIIVYFLAIGFIIGFGATFSITNVATNLGNNNPFRYLDAWTFPVAIVAVCVFSFEFLKWNIISIKEIKKIKNHKPGACTIIK